MPKRSRHREQMKAGGQVPVRTGQPAKQPPQSSATSPSPIEKPAINAPKPPSSPADPEKKRLAKREANDRYRDRLKEKAPAVLAELTARWPTAFPEDESQIRPWAIGLTNEIAKHGMPYSKNLIRAALKLIANSEAYQMALAAGGSRFDLEGNECGEVSAEHRAEAVKLLEALRANEGGTP